MSESLRNPCERLFDLIPAYSLGATDPDETAFIQAHLARCPDAAALAEFAQLAEGLHYSAPPVAAPPHILNNIMRAVAPTPPARAVRSGQQRAGWLMRLAAAAAILVIVGLNLFWVARLEESERKQADLQVALALISAEGAQRVSLPPSNTTTPEAPPAANLISDPAREVALLHVQGFPALAPEKAYQVWLIKDGKRVSGGLFRVDAGGAATFVIRAPQPFGNYDEVGITPEPAQGSNAPTAPPVVRGAIRL